MPSLGGRVTLVSSLAWNAFGFSAAHTVGKLRVQVSFLSDSSDRAVCGPVRWFYQVKVLAANPGDLSLISRTHLVEGEH